MRSLPQSRQSDSAVTALITVLFACSPILPLAAGPADPPGGVTIAWDPNPEPDVIGYRVHYGDESGVYTEVIDVGPATQFEITGLIEDQSYFCSVTAYNSHGMDSDYADELLVIHTVDPIIEEQEFRISEMSFGAGHLVTFEVSGMIGKIVEVWASHNLTDWTLIDSLIDLSGSITIEDPAAEGESRRFYQLRIPLEQGG